MFKSNIGYCDAAFASRQGEAFVEDKVSPRKRLKQIKGEIEALKKKALALKNERKNIRSALQAAKTEKPAG